MGDRVRIALVCEQCGERNYHTTKKKSGTQERIQRKKFCPRCNRHTTHKEQK